MADQSFFENKGPFSLRELALIGDAELVNVVDPEIRINDVKPLDIAGLGEISFLSNPKYAEEFKKSEATACILSASYVDLAPDGMALLVARDPYKAYAKIATHFYNAAKQEGVIHPTALISNTAKIGHNVTVGPYCVIEDGVVVGDNTLIDAQCFVGENSKIGDNCQLFSQVSVKYALLGDNVTLYSGVRIGEDGFGFAPDPAGHVKVPQLGRVLIGSNSEIGANTCIDRGSGPDTIIGEGCWIDNLCQIAHNVVMGRGCIIAAQTGISGSTVLEDFVVTGGQVGLAGHLTVGMGTQITGKSGVISDIPPGQVYAGFPARPRKEFFRGIATLTRLAKGKGKIK